MRGLGFGQPSQGSPAGCQAVGTRPRAATAHSKEKKRPCLRVAGVPAPVRCSSPDAGVPIRGGPPIDVRAPRGVVPARRGPGACDWVGMGMGMGSRPARGGQERVGSPRAGVRGVWWRMRS
jgi:hypothetical protein